MLSPSSSVSRICFLPNFCSFAIILINTSKAQAYVTLSDLPSWVGSQTTRIFYSTLTKGYTEVGELRGNFVSILPESIYSVISYARF